MKNLILILICILVFACSNKEKHNNSGKPRIQFGQTEFDFGEVISGEKVSHRFIFKNVGEGDLTIENVISSCGCTVVNYDKMPILTNEESFIEVSFDSEGYKGVQMKEIEVYSNCDSSKTTLKMWAKVNEPID